MKKLVLPLTLICSLIINPVFAEDNVLNQQIQASYSQINIDQLLRFNFKISTGWRKKSRSSRRQESRIREDVLAQYRNYVDTNNIEETVVNDVVFQEEQVCEKYEKVTNVTLDGSMNETNSKNSRTEFGLMSAVGALAGGFLGIFPVLGVGGMAAAGGFFNTDFYHSKHINETTSIVGLYQVNEAFECKKYRTYVRGSIEVVPSLSKMTPELAVRIVTKLWTQAMSHFESNTRAANDLLNRIIASPVVNHLRSDESVYDGEQITALLVNTPIESRYVISRETAKSQTLAAVNGFILYFKNLMFAINNDLKEINEVFPSRASAAQEEYDLLVSKILSFERDNVLLGFGNDQLQVFDAFEVRRFGVLVNDDFSEENSILNKSAIEANQTEWATSLSALEQQQKVSSDTEDIIRQCGRSTYSDNGNNTCVSIALGNQLGVEVISRCGGATSSDSGLNNCLRQIVYYK